MMSTVSSVNIIAVLEAFLVVPDEFANRKRIGHEDFGNLMKFEKLYNGLGALFLWHLSNLSVEGASHV